MKFAYRNKNFYSKTEDEIRELESIKRCEKDLSRVVFKVLVKTACSNEIRDLPPLIACYITTRICSFMNSLPDDAELKEKECTISFNGKETTKKIVDWLDEIVCLGYTFLDYYKNPLKFLSNEEAKYCWSKMLEILSEVGLEPWLGGAKE